MDEIIFFEFKYGDLILIRKQYCFLLYIFIIILLKMTTHKSVRIIGTKIIIFRFIYIHIYIYIYIYIYMKI